MRPECFQAIVVRRSQLQQPLAVPPPSSVSIDHAFILFHFTGRLAGTSTLRPFFLRAASTFAPPTLAMRVRKPETRARFRRVPSSVWPLPCLRLHSTTSPRKSCATRLSCCDTSSWTPADESEQQREKETRSRHSRRQAGDCQRA